MHRGLTVLILSALAAGCRRDAPLAPARSSGFEAGSPQALSALGYIGGSQGRAADSVAPPAIPAPTAAPARAAAASPNVPGFASSLKLIRTATLEIEVLDFNTAALEASRAATAFGGYVSDRQANEDGSGGRRGQVTLRIPAERFDGAMSALKKLGRVRNEAVSTQDVTRAYSDLETRLRVKRETAARLREILVRQTGEVAEVLAVEREIARVVEEIEQAEGGRRYFDNQVSLSTLTLTLHEPNALVAPGALDPLLQALRRSARVASESLAALIDLSAGLLPWICALYLAFRIVRFRLRRRS